MGIRNLKPRGTLDRSATADLFRHTLSRIPSLYGRLLYLNSLRDPNSGVYRHYGLTNAFGREQSIQALETAHHRAFRDWLKLKLAEKREDLASYLETLDDPKHLAVKYWLESRSFLGCIPDVASKAEKAHFTADTEILLATFIKPSVGGGKPAQGLLRQK